MTDNNNDKPDYRELYKKLLNDPNFENLETELQKPNIFNILGIGRAEIRHSNFLAWLFDPNESHGLGNRFLIRVLRDLAIMKNELDIFKINELNFSDVEVEREVYYSNKDKKHFIDILIIFRNENDKLVVCIENKIDTTDSDEQLTNYRKYIEGTFKKDDGYKNVFVYLTPNGINPNNADEIEKWNNYSYAERDGTSGIIKHLANMKNSITDSAIKTYISDYLSILKYEIMENKNSNIETMANSIFDKHRPIFEFVFKNKSNELYKLDWEKNYPSVIEYAEKFKKRMKKFDDEIDDELGYTTVYISVKRNKQICYMFNPYKGKSGGSMAFNFEKKEKPDLFNSIEYLLTENKSGKFNEKGKYFTINKVYELIDEKQLNMLEEMHKLRFPQIDSPKQ